MEGKETLWRKVRSDSGPFLTSISVNPPRPHRENNSLMMMIPCEELTNPPVTWLKGTRVGIQRCEEFIQTTKINNLQLYTLYTVYRVAICPRRNLPYIQNYPINNAVFNLIYPVGSWIYLPYKWFYPINGYPINDLWCIRQLRRFYARAEIASARHWIPLQKLISATPKSSTDFRRRYRRCAQVLRAFLISEIWYWHVGWIPARSRTHQRIIRSFPRLPARRKHSKTFSTFRSRDWDWDRAAWLLVSGEKGRCG